MTAIELITKGEWEHVLFTSYAISLSFFESQLLKEGVVRNGCRHIDVLADVDGYAMTLNERQSSRVGVDYRLVPVALENGVFHPKITLLSGKDGEMLLVGSGNLTFYGYGRNLEVIEILPLVRHPEMAVDVKSFLAELSNRKDILAAQISCLDFWREKYAAESSRLGAIRKDRPVRMVHSGTRPVGAQMVALAESIGPVTEVRVLSPFFDPKGDGILDFAERLACPKLVVGLVPGREKAATFPFGATRKSTAKVTAALVDAPKDERRLHAKWIELLFKGGERLVLTGSINATRKSLMTCDNVEVGVVRLESSPTKSPLGWKPCRVPSSYEKLSFRGAGVGARLFVHADLSTDGVIRGPVLGTKLKDGTWKGTLAWPDGREREISATVDPLGAFAANVIHIEDALISTGLQVTLREPNSERVAIGWVNQHAMLQAGRRGFLSPSTFLRLMSGTADASDDAALLRYIATGMTQLLDVFAVPSTARIEQSEHGQPVPDQRDSAPGRRYAAGDLAPTNVPDGALGRFGAEISDDARAIRYLMRTLRHRLLDRNREDEEARDQSGARNRGYDGDDAEETAITADDANDPAEDVAAFFDGQVRQLLARATAPMMRGAIYSAWLESILPYLMRHASEPDAPQRFAREWFALATSEQEKNESPPSLIEYVTSAGLFIVASEKNTDPMDANHVLKTTMFVHERLARFHGGDISTAILEFSAINPQQWPAIFMRRAAIWRDQFTPETALRCVTAVPTFSQQVQLIDAVIRAGTALPAGLPISYTKAGRMLIAEAVQYRRLPAVHRQESDSPICPNCHLRMSSSVQSDLRSEHLGQCGNCMHFVSRAR